MHPAALLFLGLSPMLLLPHCPYCIVFFYNCLGVFFICVTGREMHDVFYTVPQPVKKRAVAAEACVFAVPFVRDTLDTHDPQHLPAKWMVLAAGMRAYAGLAYTVWRKAQKSFEAMDL